MPRRRVRFTKFFHSSVLLLFFHSSVYLAGLIFTSGLLVMLPVSHGFIPGLRVIPLIALLASSTEKMLSTLISSLFQSIFAFTFSILKRNLMLTGIYFYLGVFLWVFQGQGQNQTQVYQKGCFVKTAIQNRNNTAGVKADVREYVREGIGEEKDLF